MKRTDLNRRLSDIFDSGRLPVMNYITLQNHERKTISRPLHRHESVCELLLVYKGTGIYHTGKNLFLSRLAMLFIIIRETSMKWKIPVTQKSVLTV